MDNVVVVTTTVAARSQADLLCAAAVTGSFAACGQIGGPVSSTYRWQGNIETAEEWQVQFKTAADRVDALVDYLRAAHPYEVPEILVTPVVGGNPAYAAWVVEQTRP